MKQLRLESSYILLRDVRLYGFHGVLSQERAVGAGFVVNLRIGYPLEAAMQTDALADTLSYAEVYELVKCEFKQPSALLEHVAGRIVDRLLQRMPAIQSIDLTIIKENPPMGADCDGAGVEIHLINDKTHR